MIEQKDMERIERTLGIKLSEALIKKINEEAQVVSFPTQTLVVREGECLSFIYFMLKGLARGYYLDEEGNEITKCFSKEDNLFSTEGFRGNHQATFYIETLEACRCIRFPYDFLHQLMREEEAICVAIEKLFYQEIQRLEVRSKQMLLLDAPQRYKAFLQEYPGLIKRAKKQYVASYIGIKPGSLSRIIKSFEN